MALDDSRALVVPFDRTLSQQPTAAAVVNRGCPVGYFAQFMAPPGWFGGSDGAVHVTMPPIGDGVNGPWLRCRRIEGFTAADNAVESGQAAAENWQHYVDSVGEIAQAAAGGFGILGVLAIGAALVWLGSQRSTTVVVRENPRRRLARHNPPAWEWQFAKYIARLTGARRAYAEQYRAWQLRRRYGGPTGRAAAPPAHPGLRVRAAARIRGKLDALEGG